MEHYIANVKEPICVRHITMSDVLYDVEEKYLFDQLETVFRFVEACTLVGKLSLNFRHHQARPSLGEWLLTIVV